MFNIMDKKWIFIGISIALIVLSLGSIIFQGFNLDTDFAGGMALTYEIKGDFTVEQIEKLASEALGNDRRPSSVQLSEGNDVVIKFGYDNDLETEEERSQYAIEKINAITAALENEFGAPEIVGNESELNGEINNDAVVDDSLVDTDENAADVAGEGDIDADAADTADADETDTDAAEAALAAENDTDVQTTALDEEEAALGSGVLKKSQDVVSPSTGKELARSAMWMSVLAAIAILIYVSIRFEFTSGVAAVIGLLHDVIILIGIYSLLRVSIDTSFIAAVLTVLGYSINNTIVVFDRIRENTKRAKKQTYADIANNSIVQTLTRSINTTITTILTIGMVYLLGVVSIKAFALPIIIGIVIGTYSSIFVTGPIWAIWKDSAVKAKKKAKTA